MSKGRIVTWVAPRGWAAVRSWLRAPAGTLALLGAGSLIALARVLHLRRLFEFDPWSLASFWPLGFDPYVLGLAVQEWMVPVGLAGLLALTPAMRRWVLAAPAHFDALRLGLGLAGAQLLYFAYLWALERRDVGHLTAGEVLVVFAGFLLGPGWGLTLGTFTAAAVAGFNAITWSPGDAAWGEVLRWYLIDTTPTAALIWLGGAAGLLARFFPRGAAPLAWALATAGLVPAARLLSLLGEATPAEGGDQLLPLALAGAAFLAGLGLVLRGLRTREVERRAREGELALSRAELSALRAQINPHFLFNALNTIRYFVRTDPEAARRLLLKLSEVFQRVLHSGAFVPLADEIRYAEAYLELEQARLGERLRVEWTRPEGRLLQLEVPALILEPLVENAVAHGLAPKPEGGTLRVLIERWGGELVVQVRDDGVGFDPKAPRPPGDDPPVALANITQRLRMLYGDAYAPLIESEPGRGTRVQLRLPIPPGFLEEA